MAERKLTSKVTHKTYFKGRSILQSKNVIYLIISEKCKDEYIGLAVTKLRFRIHESDIKKGTLCDL